MRNAMMLLGLLLASPAMADGPHCWCNVYKSDCGDCSDRCIAREFGAIAEFRPLQLHKDDLCRTACAAKFSALSDAAACDDLASRLAVPRPWSGEVQACWAVGAGSYRVEARRSVQCAAPPPGPVYPPPGASYWKTTLWDDFKGKPANASPDQAACYDRDPSCVTFYHSGPHGCDARAAPGLAALDKCTWTVLDRTSWMGGDTSAFDPREVRVDPARENGVLVLSARAVRPDGSYAPTGSTHVRNGQTLADKPLVRPSELESGYDCAQTAWPEAQRDRCSIMSGAVVSQRYGGGSAPAGFAQQYGRFTVRGRIPYGAGSFPSFWMLPVEGSWPGAGEIDVFESPPDGSYVWQSLHAGVCTPGEQPDLDPAACLAGGGSRWHQHKDGGKTRPVDGPVSEPFWSSFHTFGIEWDASSLAFFVDGRQTHVIHDLDYVSSDKTGVAHHWWNRRQWEAWLPVHVPSAPFHWLFNVAVHEQDGKRPNPKNFVPQEMLVDWVKVEQRCLTRADFCPSGGDFNPSTGACSSQGPRPLDYPSPCKR